MKIPRSIMRAVCLAASLLFLRPDAAPPTKPIRSQLTYYSAWDATKIPVFQRFDLVTLQPGEYSPDTGEVQAIAQIRSKGTLVLLYVTLGEDDATYNQLPAVKGDGRGPVHWDLASNAPVYEKKGVASYYLDEWNANGYDSDPVNKVPDGIPDRQGDWGSCLVNAGDPAWQAQVLATVKTLMDEGADGLFLDTPETADPWHGYGWTAQGMYELIKKIRDAYPDKFLLLNRGLFFFEPVFPYHYQWNPRKLVNAVLFESYYSDSDYPVDLGGNGSSRVNPFFELNKYTSAPRINAEFGRSDSYGPILHIDYTADPVHIAQTDKAFYDRVIQEAAVDQGWVPQITDRLLGLAPTTVLDNPPAPDRAPPAWQNTSVGFSDLLDPAPPFFMAKGDDHSAADFRSIPPAPRVGLLKAIPGNGQVTLRWDVAADQTRPVRYNVYYSKNAPLDFDKSTVLAGVKTEVGGDYLIRGYIDADDACPYEFTVTGLENGALYRFAVRAEDGTSGVTSPSAGRIGPGKGIEDANREILMAIPVDSVGPPIAIDGSFADWDPIAGIPDSVGDGTDVDFTQLKLSDDTNNLYLYVETAAALDPSKIEIWFNSDRRSFTGDTTRLGSGFRGADYLWKGGAISKFTAGAWQSAVVATTYRAAGNRMEIQIAKRGIGGETGPGMNLLLMATQGMETLPDHGVAGLAYTYIHPISKIDLLGVQTPSAPAPLRQEIRFAAGGNGPTIRFLNPEKMAEILIRDTDGRLLAGMRGITGGEIEWHPPAGLHRMVICTVLAKGLPAASRMLLSR